MRYGKYEIPDEWIETWSAQGHTVQGLVKFIEEDPFGIRYAERWAAAAIEMDEATKEEGWEEGAAWLRLFNMEVPGGPDKA